MPIYEYICHDCDEKFSFFVRQIGASVATQCPGCGGEGVERLVSTFAYHKSISTIHEESGGPPKYFDVNYYKDPRNVGRWAENKAKELGVELPREVQQEIQAAREGELPQSLKEKL